MLHSVALAKGISSLEIARVFNSCCTICVTHKCAFVVSEKKKGPIILLALTAHHTWTLTLCNGCPWTVIVRIYMSI
jgi:heterodisulfide reductase subunit B